MITKQLLYIRIANKKPTTSKLPTQSLDKINTYTYLPLTASLQTSHTSPSLPSKPKMSQLSSPHTLPIRRPDATYHIPHTPNTSQTTIFLPPHSSWTSGLHFHTQHTEYLRLIRGSIAVYLDGSTIILSAAAGGQIDVTTGTLTKGLVVEVPRWARHEWRRAEAWFIQQGPSGGIVRPEDLHDEVVVEEWTDPGDISKPLFFWNLCGVLFPASTTTAPALSMAQRVVKAGMGDGWTMFQALVIFWELDNWPVLLGMRGLLGGNELVYGCVGRPVETLMAFVVLFMAKMLGWVIGVRAVEKERTPDELWESYWRHGI
jgi:hypothetical protein